MKRIFAACQYQTLGFILDPSLDIEEAKSRVLKEVETYKSTLGDNGQILNEIYNEDGTVVLEVRKKVSGYSIGKYFN